MGNSCITATARSGRDQPNQPSADNAGLKGDVVFALGSAGFSTSAKSFCGHMDACASRYFRMPHMVPLIRQLTKLAAWCAHPSDLCLRPGLMVPYHATSELQTRSCTVTIIYLTTTTACIWLRLPRLLSHLLSFVLLTDLLRP